MVENVRVVLHAPLCSPNLQAVSVSKPETRRSEMMVLHLNRVSVSVSVRSRPHPSAMPQLPRSRLVSQYALIHTHSYENRLWSHDIREI